MCKSFIQLCKIGFERFGEWTMAMGRFLKMEWLSGMNPLSRFGFEFEWWARGCFLKVLEH